MPMNQLKINFLDLAIIPKMNLCELLKHARNSDQFCGAETNQNNRYTASQKRGEYAIHHSQRSRHMQNHVSFCTFCYNQSGDHS